MNCGEGRTCHFACDCREADFAAKLVAADHCRASADRALYAERCRVVDLEKKLAASEARVGRYEAILRLSRHYATRIEKASEKGDTVWARNTANNIVEAIDEALAPPPEAEKKGGEK